MQNYVVRLESPVATSFRCQKAANSLDIDIKKKSIHELKIQADLDSPYTIGLIVGASGSGKTTLCKKIFGDDCFKEILDPTKPVIEQFPDDWDYEKCALALSGMGLTSVPCWIRPAYTLSNGQRARAEAALQLSKIDQTTTVLDEWTSVVDRTVAKAMSHCVQKFARKQNKQIVLAACHYDIADWLNPDWIIDCNKQTFTDNRSMVGSHKRSDQLRLDIKEIGRNSWKYFSKYHYLSERLPGGKIYTFGLFSGKNQIGFQCFAAYIIGNHTTFFSNRTVIHPDYAGIGLGIHLINETSKEMIKRGFKVKAKFSSMPIYKSMKKQEHWVCTKINNQIKKHKVNAKIKSKQKNRASTMRSKSTTYHFDFVWKPTDDIITQR